MARRGLPAGLRRGPGEHGDCQHSDRANGDGNRGQST